MTEIVVFHMKNDKRVVKPSQSVTFDAFGRQDEVLPISFFVCLWTKVLIKKGCGLATSFVAQNFDLKDRNFSQKLGPNTREKLIESIFLRG